MNYLLEKLASESWKYADKNSTEGDNKFGNLQLSKFSELIIKECVSIIINEGKKIAIAIPRVDSSNYVQVATQSGKVAAAMEYAAKIKQQFQVE